jgi:hypothetical protein
LLYIRKRRRTTTSKSTSHGFARSLGKRREDSEDEELSEIAFPENGAAMINIFRKVIIINYYQEAHPRCKL